MRIGVGILGFAHGHVNAYCQKWRDVGEYGMDVLAGWDHDAARLSKAAGQHHFAPHGNVDELLGRKDIRAVVIAAETSMHTALVEAVARHGKAIVLQKPMALTLPEADRIVAAVERHGVPFTLAWQMRVDPQNVKIKELLAGGRFGRLFMVRRRHGLPTHVWAGFRDLWHVNPSLNRDIWADDASHPIDFLLWLLGVPEFVTAEIDSLLDPKVPMDNGIAVFRYPGGPLAEVCCSFTCVAGENTTEVVAEKGTIIQNYGDVPSCSVPRPADAAGLKWYFADEKKWTISDVASPPEHGARIAGLAGPLADFLHGKRAAIATAEEGRMALRMTLASHLSAREGRRVRIDDEAIARV